MSKTNQQSSLFFFQIYEINYKNTDYNKHVSVNRVKIIEAELLSYLISLFFLFLVLYFFLFFILLSMLNNCALYRFSKHIYVWSRENKKAACGVVIVVVVLDLQARKREREVFAKRALHLYICVLMIKFKCCWDVKRLRLRERDTYTETRRFKHK